MKKNRMRSTSSASYDNLKVRLNNLYRKYTTPPDRMPLSEWAEKHIFIGGGTGPDVGPMRTAKAPYQKEILDECGNPHNRRVVLLMAAQTGKALSLETEIPTPSGWTLLKDLKVGDTIFDGHGSETKITFITPIQYDRVCYQIEFTDGSKIVADAEHQWEINRPGTRWSFTRQPPRILTTAELRVNDQLNCAATINYPEKGLSIDPYFLGLWLGDGSSRGAGICGADADLQFYISQLPQNEHYVLRHYKNRASALIINGYDGTHCQHGHLYRDKDANGYHYCKICKSNDNRSFGKCLIDYNLIQNKHIPACYLQASAKQRLSLLQGLIDSDGWIGIKGQCEFYNTNKRLIDDVHELIRSLGFKCRIHSKFFAGKYRYAIRFFAYSDTPVARLPRKVNRQKKRTDRSYLQDFQSIKSIEQVFSVPVRCLQVDSQHHTFMASKGFIPTHNTIMQSCVGSYYMAGDPSSILAVLPSTSAAKKWHFSKLNPTIAASPILSDLLLENTILRKIYPGGYFVLVGARSVDAFRMLSVRVLLLDEIDAWPLSIKEEGDPLSLARGRTTAYWNSKEILVSTPTTKDTSIIYPEFLESDQRHFYVPCPHCGQYQVLYWRSIGYDNDDPKTAHFRCQFTKETVTDEEWIAQNHYYKNRKRFKKCGKTASEAKKMEMLRKGVWVKHNPTSDTPGFWLAATYSPWFSWEQLVREWVKAKLPDQQKTFIQTRLAEPWEERTDKIESHELIARQETYKAHCPEGVGFIIGSVDVQQNRLECTVWGIGKDEETWVLDHQIFYGEVYQNTAWTQLARFMNEASYANAHGAKALVNAWAIDTGAFTPHVYPFLRNITVMGIPIYGIKGSSNYKADPTPSRPSFNKEHKVNVWEVGVNEIKNILVPRMAAAPPGPGTLHIPLIVDAEFLNQLTAEERIRKANRKTGLVEMYWKKRYVRNEILDTYVYAYAVYLMHFKNKGANVDTAVERIKSTAIPEQTEQVEEPKKNEIKVSPFKPEAKKQLPGAGSWYSGFNPR